MKKKRIDGKIYWDKVSNNVRDKVRTKVNWKVWNNVYREFRVKIDRKVYKKVYEK